MSSVEISRAIEEGEGQDFVLIQVIQHTYIDIVEHSCPPDYRLVSMIMDHSDDAIIYTDKTKVAIIIRKRGEGVVLTTFTWGISPLKQK